MWVCGIQYILISTSEVQTMMQINERKASERLVQEKEMEKNF
jgi:hypothetical protein